MSFDDNASLDTSRVGSGGGGRGVGPGPVIAGGGVVGLIITVLVVLLGGGDMLGTDTSSQGEQGEDLAQRCQTGADANADRDCRAVATENSLYDYWSQQPDLAADLRAAGQDFRAPAQVTIYEGQTQSRCGTASNQIGPFYCPLDERIFLDTDFFDILQQRLGAQDGALAEEYVLAHEYGHHIQNLYGVLEESQRDPQGADSGAVRVELMADCFAGMWIQHAGSTQDSNGNRLMEGVTEEDVADAMSAAKAVGDDVIQERSGGEVNPDGWTHGSAQARQTWLGIGMQASSLDDCDTFAVADPDNPGS